MVSSKTVHSCYTKTLLLRKTYRYAVWQRSWCMTLLDAFSCFLLFYVNQKRVHINTESNKHLDWLACSLILRRTHNLNLMQCFKLKLRILTITEIVFSCWWRWTNSTWVVTEIELVCVQAYVLVDFIALDIIEIQIYVS